MYEVWATAERPLRRRSASGIRAEGEDLLALAAEGFATRLALLLDLGLGADAVFLDDDAPPEEAGLLPDVDRAGPDGRDEDEVLARLAACWAASCCRW